MNKYYNHKLFCILIIISFIIFLTDINKESTSECIKKTSKKKKLIILLFLHQILVIFGNFGWLFNNKIMLILYLIIPLVVTLHWATNNNRCYLTLLENKICGYNQYYFDDVFQIIGLKKFSVWNNYLHYIYLAISFSIAFYKLIIIYKINTKLINTIIISLIITLTLTIIPRKLKNSKNLHKIKLNL